LTLSVIADENDPVERRVPMVGESNYDRAYLMALGAWKAFGHTSEPPRAFARRMAVIGESKGINKAAEAISEDCEQHGLRMSPRRVLKSLSHNLERHRHDLSRLNSIEEFDVDEIGKIPPGVAELFASEATLKRPSVPWGCLLLIVIVLIIAWVIFH
jgi:hypothetical protein